MKPFPPDIAKRLRDHRFPDDAIKKIEGKAGGRLNSIDTNYIIELFNDVFGIASWTVEQTYEKIYQDESGNVIEIVAKGQIIAEIDGEQYKTPIVSGGNSNVYSSKWEKYTKEISDISKGAFTAVLSKASSYWGVGLYVYKGDLDRRRKEMSNITEKLLEKMKWDGVVHADGSVYLEGDTGRYPIYLDEASLKLCRSLSKTWTDGKS